MFREFRTFIAQGNVLDLAVGIIIGVAFGKIVTSLVEDILNPVIGLVVGGVDFSMMKNVLKEAAGTALEIAIRYGNFLNEVIQFLIVAYVIFLTVKVVNRIKLSDSMALKA